MHARGYLAWLLVLAAAAGCGRGHPSEEQRRHEVEIALERGVLSATLYPALEQPSPGLLLLHDRPGDRGDWVLFATRAQQAGYTCLAPDLGWSIDASAPLDRSALSGRIGASLERLREAGASPERVGIVGAGVGANLALEYAAENREIRAVALASPGMEYAGFRADKALSAYGRKPVFFLTGTGDAYSAQSARQLQEMAKGFAELREYPGAAHGTDIFTTSENASAQLLDWLDTVLK